MQWKLFLYLSYGRAVVSSDCLDALGIKCGRGLLRGLVAEAHVSLFALEDAGKIDLNRNQEQEELMTTQTALQDGCHSITTQET